MGCFLLTETMSRHYQLGMDSYDRLFPSQDTMPHGGFGNLIALPLQHEARQQGNSVFVDAELTPYPGDEQWAFLASVARIDPATVETVAREAIQRDAVLGVRVVDAVDDDDENAAPWMRPPSRKPKHVGITQPLPATVRAILAQKLFVEKIGLPSPLLDQIKRLAAFQNPEFYKKESMRLSTAMTPRIIACAEELPQYIGLPRGLVAELAALLGSYSVALDVEDRRVTGDPLIARFRGNLTPVQIRAASALLENDMGVFVAGPARSRGTAGGNS